MNWAFLLAWFLALSVFAVFVGVVVVLIRAAFKTSGRPTGVAGSGNNESTSTPPNTADDSLMYLASPLLPYQHPTPDDPNRHHTADPGPSPSSFDSGPSSSQSFDSGSSASPSFDSGSSSMGSDSGSNCG